jgi:hypothetical protein
MRGAASEIKKDGRPFYVRLSRSVGITIYELQDALHSTYQNSRAFTGMPVHPLHDHVYKVPPPRSIIFVSASRTSSCFQKPFLMHPMEFKTKCLECMFFRRFGELESYT